MAVVSSGGRRPRRAGAGSSVPLVISMAAVVLLLLGLDTPGWITPGVPSAPDWRHPLAEAETALAAGDLDGAVAPWREARRRALAAHTWDGLLEVGEAYRRLGDAGGFARDATTTARELFLVAKFRARGEGSLEGVLRAAGAFAKLGDREAAAVTLRVADGLARGDAAGRARVRTAADRWSVELDRASLR